MILHIYEILDKVRKAITPEEKVKILKANDSSPLQQVLVANFSEKVKFQLSKEPTPYKKSSFPIALGDTSILKEARRLYVFVEGGHPTLPQLKRQLLWVQILEALPPEEADLMEQLKNKNLGKVFGLTKSLVKEAFPHLFVGESLEDPTPIIEDKKTLTETLVNAAKDLGLPVKKKRGRKPKAKPEEITEVK